MRLASSIKLIGFKPSPLFNDVSLGPPDCSAYWLVTQDGIRIKVGLWKAKHPREQFLFVLVTLNISKNMVKLHNFLWNIDTQQFHWIGEDTV